jgi:uncharacterized integral membrane protein
MIIYVPKPLLVAIVFFPVFGLFHNAFHQLVNIIHYRRGLEKLHHKFAVKEATKVVCNYFIGKFVNIHVL